MSVRTDRSPALPDRAPEAWLLVAVAAVVVALELVIALAAADGIADVRLAWGVVTATALPAVALVGWARGTVPASAALLAVVAGPAYGYTALVLPWTQVSFAVAQASIELLLAVPVVGAPLAALAFGGITLSQETLELFAAYHLVASVLLVLAGALALWLSGDADR